MKRAAIYVKDPAARNGSVVSKEDQEKACRLYCNSKDLAVLTTFSDAGGSRDEFARMIAEATADNPPFDVIVVWRLNRFSISLEETIECRDRLRRAGTKLVSTSEKWVED